MKLLLLNFSFLVILFNIADVNQVEADIINKSYALSFWGGNIGYFEMNAEIHSKNYTISSVGKAKGIINLFSEFNISSGARGLITAKEKLNPVEAILSWSSRLGAYRSNLIYENEKLISFEVSPPIEDVKHKINPIGLESTLDPVSSMLWFLNDREFANLCKGRIRILDGFRLSEVIFEKKINVNESVKCVGSIKKIAGFKPKFDNRKTSGFSMLYVPTPNKKFEVVSFDFDTFLGKISVNKI